MKILEIRDLKKRKDGIDLEIDYMYLKKGEKLAVVGENGSGKSLIFNILLNLYSSNSGSIMIFDEDFYENISEIKGQIAAIPKSNWLMDNKTINGFLKSTLRRYNINDRSMMMFYKKEFNIDYNKKISSLNPLERRKLAIVNALMLKRNLLLIDEPMTISDEDIRRGLYKEISHTNSSVIVFTESLEDALNYCNRIYYLHEGKIINEESLDQDLIIDKIFSYKSSSVPVDDFLDIGAIALDDETNYKRMYFTGELQDLTRLIYSKGLKDYTIKNASLTEKMAYLQSRQDIE